MATQEEIAVALASRGDIVAVCEQESELRSAARMLPASHNPNRLADVPGYRLELTAHFARRADSSRR